MTKAKWLAAVATVGFLGLSGTAHATLVATGSVGGAPTGVTLDNLNALTVAGPSPQTTATGVGVSFVQDAAVVTGTSTNFYAAPYLSGSNGNGFGNAPVPGADNTTYVTTGSTGKYASAALTFTLPGEEKYFGLLWGSVDAYNTLAFYDGNTLVGTLTGSQVLAGANGNQGVNGTLYVNINSDLQFNKVVATSSQYAFEIDNIAYNPTAVPEPISLALLGGGLVGLGVLRRRRA